MRGASWVDGNGMRQCDRHELALDDVRKDLADLRTTSSTAVGQCAEKWRNNDAKWKTQGYTNREVVQLRSDFRLANFKITGLVLLASVVGNFVAAWIFARLT